jgi:hypothetical protein
VVGVTFHRVAVVEEPLRQRRTLRGAIQPGGLDEALNVLLERDEEPVVSGIKRPVGDAVRRREERVGIDHRARAAPSDALCDPITVTVPQHHEGSGLGAFGCSLSVVGVDRTRRDRRGHQQADRDDRHRTSPSSSPHA